MTVSVWNQTDATVKEVYSLMVRDFSRFENIPFGVKANSALHKDPVIFRDLEWPVLGDVEAYRFKMLWQLQHFLKRHRFSSDAFSDDELDNATNAKFIGEQVRLAGSHKPCGITTHMVLQEARRLAKSILGPKPDIARAALEARFGKRATIGNARVDAYLDNKLGDPEAFTCPTSLRAWFFSLLHEDPHLALLVRRLFKKSKGKLPLGVDYLNLVNVPKSWKVRRGITPLSNIGLFFTNGLRGQIEESLSNHGLPINRLQFRHQMLAQSSSKTRKNATTDLVNASNSILSWLLNCVLPRAWYNTLKLSFVQDLIISGKTYHCMSVLPMGNTCTFPIETLIFYCLIKAIGNLLKVKGIYSVYGDDLIYPCKIHGHVCAVFAKLGLLVGAEKSFASTSSFRESCGGDFYRGVNVRPALAPEVDAACFTGLEYTSWLYKLYNVIAERWSWHDLPSVFSFLLGEIAFCSGSVFMVPPSYPDHSGIKSDIPRESFPWLPITYPKRVIDKCSGHSAIIFKHIDVKVPNRAVLVEDAYYWDWLRQSASHGRKNAEYPNFLDYHDRFMGLLRLVGYHTCSGFFPKPKVVEPALFLKYNWERVCVKTKFGRRFHSSLIPEKLDPRKVGSPVVAFCKSKASFTLQNQVSLVQDWA